MTTASVLKLSLDFSAGNISVFNGPKAIRVGAEICLNYGPFSNEKLLLVYGFVVPNNPHNSVEIFAPLSTQDPLYELKAGFLRQRCGINHPNDPHSLVMPLRHHDSTLHSVLPSSLLSTLRLIGVRSYEQLLAVLAHAEDEAVDRNIDYEIPIISPENEEAALTALESALHSMARRLALNLISDENLNAAAREHPADGTFETILEQRQEIEESEEEVNFSPNRNTNHDQGVNKYNTRILCWGEYQILQMAIADVHHRLELLASLPGE